MCEKLDSRRVVMKVVLEDMYQEGPEIALR